MLSLYGPHHAIPTRNGVNPSQGKNWIQSSRRMWDQLYMQGQCHIHDIPSATQALQAHLCLWSSDLQCYLAQYASHDLWTFLCSSTSSVHLIMILFCSTLVLVPPLRYLHAVCTAPAFVPLVCSSCYCTFHLLSFILFICSASITNTMFPSIFRL